MNAHVCARPDRKSPAGGELDITVVRDVSEFAALRDEWDALFSRTGLPHQLFQQHCILEAWARHFGGRRCRLQVILVRRNGSLVAAWPLVERRHFGLTIARLMGEPIAQFGDVLAEPDLDRRAVERIWQAVDLIGADFAMLRNVRTDAMLMSALGGRRAVVLRVARSPYVELAAGTCGDGPGERYSAKYRSNYRRRLRRLQERAEIVFRSDVPDCERLALVDRAVEIKRRTLGRSLIRPSPVFDRRFLEFFRTLASMPKVETGLQVEALTADGAPVAVDISFDCKTSSFGYLTAHDSAFSRDGLGTILVHHVFAAALRRGNRVLDMMAPADDYKLQHADGTTEVRDLAIAGSLLGRLVLCLYRLALRLRRS